MNIAPERIAALLPQTQCQQCGYSGCTPYAQALSRGEAMINLCTPGGQTVIDDLAKLLHLPILQPADPQRAAQPKSIAYIDETECIGCTACIRACPVDAIIGATKQMHSVIQSECTGCELCVPPCPVDCIHLQPVEDKWLPRSHILSNDCTDERFAAAKQAQMRYQHRSERLERLQHQKNAHLQASRKKTESISAPNSAPATSNRNINPADLIAKAMQRAQTQQVHRSVPDNQQNFHHQQIAKAQQQAAYRRAVRQLKYGTEEEKATALDWLQEYKKQQQLE